MSDTVIRVENLAKLYRLGEVGTGSLAHDINRWWYRARGKEDPYAQVGQVNDRTKKLNSEYIWALKDINFEVQQGEVLGIIGRNGAGKSTLLKILSRVTAPTSGEINIRGRLASLLEVGTGFHPELSGRDNIYLNGAILGMKKGEIARKLDEIIEFSGCEAYIDTPVKRYSSGMQVRLGFAVAAHLEPEVLIIDEVLAVGDYQFQKRCLGKMNEVAGQGRTILFVSHNMQLVGQLCTRSILLSEGSLCAEGPTTEIISEYYGRNDMHCMAEARFPSDKVDDKGCVLKRVWVAGPDMKPRVEYTLNDDIYVFLEISVGNKLKWNEFKPYPQVNLSLPGGEVVFNSLPPTDALPEWQQGIYIVKCRIPSRLLNNNSYEVSVAMAVCRPELEVFFHERSCVSFVVTEDLHRELFIARNGYQFQVPGAIRPLLQWEISKPIEAAAQSANASSLP